MSSHNGQSRGGSSGGERAERVAGDVSRWVGRVVGRTREEAEDIWAEAQTLREQERPVVRRGLAYGLAGAIKAGDRVWSVARGAAEGARNASQGSPPPGETPGSESSRSHGELERSE
jgi:hypothetical protein